MHQFFILVSREQPSQCNTANVTGPVTRAWAELPGLQSLNLSHNMLTGPLPPEWPQLFENLTVLDLSFNLLSGSLPEGECVYLCIYMG